MQWCCCLGPSRDLELPALIDGDELDGGSTDGGASSPHVSLGRGAHLKSNGEQSARRRKSSDASSKLDSVKLKEHDAAATLYDSDASIGSAGVELATIPGVSQHHARERLPSMVANAKADDALPPRRVSSPGALVGAVKATSLPALPVQPEDPKPILRRHSMAQTSPASAHDLDGPARRRVSFAAGVSQKSTGGMSSRSSATPSWRRYT